MKRATHLLSILWLIILMIGTASTVAEEIAIIAHIDTPSDSLSKREILDFYTGDIRRWSNDQKVIVFDLKPRSETKEIFYDFLDKSPSRMKSIWMKKMLSGEGDPPESIDTIDEILKRVTETPGSIGYVPRSIVTNNVKVVRVIKPENE